MAYPAGGVRAGDDRESVPRRSGRTLVSRYLGTTGPGLVLDTADGLAAVRLARSAIEQGYERSPGTDAARAFRATPLPPVLDEPRGVFVTLRRHPSNELRGCIGFPIPVFPLRAAIPRAAWAAAVDDPRFPAVRRSELDQLTIELSILTVPEVVEADPRSSLPDQVEVGRHGLIVERGGESGLLLPQVATEFGFDAREFLDATCEKAGLPLGSWQRPDTHVRRFEAERFEERSPGGAVRAARPG